MTNFLSSVTAAAWKVQSDTTTRATLSTGTDVYPIANLRPGIDIIRLQNPEYTGTVHRPGDIILGKGSQISFDIVMRGPGGAAPPALDAFLPGRILRAAGFAEVRSATALIAAEAIGAATSTSVTLGSSATGTSDLYTGYPLILSDQGSGAEGIAAITAYNSSKVASVAETFSSTPNANYSIPAFLGYQLDADAAQLALTFDYWLDKKRYQGENFAVSALSINWFTSSRDNAQVCIMSVGLTGDISSTDEVDEAAPAVPSAGNPPVFNDADMWLAGYAVGGSSFTFDMGISVGYAPNPNRTSGNEPAVITETRRSVALNLNEMLIATADLNAFAAAQSSKSFWAQMGSTTGNTISVVVPAGRLEPRTPDPSGQFVNTSGNLLIDATDKSINVFYPYF